MKSSNGNTPVGGRPSLRRKRSVRADGWDVPNLGTCCACGCEATDMNPVRSIFMLDFKAPPGSGSGWGCFQCGLAAEGASAAVCDACVPLLMDGRTKLRWICTGVDDKTGRLAIDSFEHVPHAHDMTKHPEEPYDPWEDDGWAAADDPSFEGLQ